MRPLSPSLVALAMILLLSVGGCSKQEEAADGKKMPRGTPITVAIATSGTAQVTERVLGRIESGTSPQIFAEVPGTVAKVLVDVGQRVTAGQTLAELDTADLRIAVETARAEVGRLEALHAAQVRTAERMDKLFQQKLVSPGMHDESQAQLKSLAEQLAGARARHASAQRSLAKARIQAPVDGVIEARQVAPGDYVDGRTPLFLVSSHGKLRIHLPFPEATAARLRPGLPVRLTSPVAPDHPPVEARIDSLTPTVSGNSHAVEAIVHVANPGSWSEGATVNGEVILEEHPGAVLIPIVSVVRRPAGDVVYVVKGDMVEQRVVKTGTRQGDLIEVVEGLQGGETVALDGAGFLTDKAPVVVRK